MSGSNKTGFSTFSCTLTGVAIRFFFRDGGGRFVSDSIRSQTFRYLAAPLRRR